MPNEIRSQFNSGINRIYRIICVDGIYHRCGEIAIGNTSNIYGLGSICLVSTALVMTNGYPTAELNWGVNQKSLCSHCFDLEDRMKIAIGRFNV